MTRRDLLVSSLLLGAGTGRAAKPQAARPNIVLVLADDLASWMCGCYGNTEIKTPNLDAFARTGVRFANSYCATPICSASRATLLTGRMPRQHGINDFLDDQPIANPPQGQKEPPASFAREVMLSDRLAGAGYTCGYIGKWHLGNDTKPGHGFTSTYTMSGGSGTYQDPVLYRNGEKVQEKGYSTDLFTKAASQFIDQQSAQKPFFLTVGYQNPHTPYSGQPKQFVDMYANTKFETVGYEPAAANALREKDLLKDQVGNLRGAAASISALDAQLPALLNKLRDKKLYDNTLVIFTSDNGYLLGRHGLWSKGLASDPINMYEEVIAVPMIWSWPGKTPPELAVPELVSFYDFVPTVCDLLDIDIPTSQHLPGRSYAPLVTGNKFPKKEPWRSLVFGEFRNTEYARDSRYKLVWRNQGAGPNELYDLRTDPREKKNEIDNLQFITIRDNLRKGLDAFRQRTAS